MVAEHRDRMPEDEGVGPDLHLFENEPDDTLAIGELERVGGLVQFGEKAFQALRQRHVCFGVRQLRLEGGQLGFGGGFPLAQRRHPLPQLLDREQFA